MMGLSPAELRPLIQGTKLSRFTVFNYRFEALDLKVPTNREHAWFCVLGGGGGYLGSEASLGSGCRALSCGFAFGHWGFIRIRCDAEGLGKVKVRRRMRSRGRGAQ